MMTCLTWITKSLLGIYLLIFSGRPRASYHYAGYGQPEPSDWRPQWPLLQLCSMSLFICNGSHIRYIIKKFLIKTWAFILSGFFLPHCQWHFSKLSINFEAIKNNFPELLLLCNEPWQMHCFDICDLRCPNHQTLGSSKAIVQIKLSGKFWVLTLPKAFTGGYSRERKKGFPRISGVTDIDKSSQHSISIFSLVFDPDKQLSGKFHFHVGSFVFQWYIHILTSLFGKQVCKRILHILSDCL